MSETSLSSIEFIRSVTSLTKEESRTQTLDVDDLFAFDDARKTLASKVSAVQSNQSLRKSAEGLQPTSSSESSTVSHPSAPLPLTFTPWRVFLNCVDTFNCKYIARYLSEQVFGSTRMPQVEGGGEEEEEQGEVDGEEEEEQDLSKKTERDEVPKFKYSIIGSLLEPGGKYDKKCVSEIIDTEDKNLLFNIVHSCGFVVYDISQHSSQIEEAEWVLSAIERHLAKLELDTPKAFAEFQDVPAFILISPFMTWARTKPVDPEEPDLPFREMDYKKRKCHPNFREHFLLEKQVVTAGKKWPDKFRTLVVCSGVTYGYEEDTLNFLFKLAWENQPELPLYLPGNNFIPLIHVQDLSAMMFQILEQVPGLKYILAVEQNLSTLRNITKAISKGLTTGDIVKLPKEDMLLLTDVSQYIFDCMTANVRMEPSYFQEQVKLNWTTDASLPYNMTSVLQEYRTSRSLMPIRILIAGPPACGKTVLAKKLSAFYQLHYLSPESIAERIIQKLKYKIDKIKAKEQAAMEKQMEREGEEMETDEDDEEGEEEEFLEEAEDEPVESMEELTESLEELLMNMEENDGHLDEEHLLKCAKEVLTSPPIRNQGYVLDGYPETVQQVKALLDSPDPYVEEEMEGEDVLANAPHFYPDYIIGLDASNEYIVDRVIELSEEEIQEKHYGEEELMRRIETYRSQNTDEIGLLSYVDEKGVHPIVISVADDKSPLLEETLQKIVKMIGDPHNFGMTPEELEEGRRLEDEQRKWEEAQELARKQEVEKQAHAERMKKLQQWANTMDAIKEEEEESFAADSLALRNYLMKYIFPTLTRGLLEVARQRPLDPIDFLAEFLFKENPEGKVFDPDSSPQMRKLYDEMTKQRDSQFSLTTPKKEEEIPQDTEANDWVFVADGPYDKFF